MTRHNIIYFNKYRRKRKMKKIKRWMWFIGAGIVVILLFYLMIIAWTQNPNIIDIQNMNQYPMPT